MVRSFYVTLPSNGSMGVYPENTVTEFRNRLPRPLHLGGEWEVGLTNFSYPYTWYQICPETSGCAWRVVDGSPEFQELKLLPLRIATVNSIGEKHYLPGYLVDLIFFDETDHNGRLRIRAEAARIVKLTGKICQSFGCSDPYVFNQNWRYNERPWKAENIEHLFVYTDIIVPQSVGDETCHCYTNSECRRRMPTVNPLMFRLSPTTPSTETLSNRSKSSSATARGKKYRSRRDGRSSRYTFVNAVRACYEYLTTSHCRFPSLLHERKTTEHHGRTSTRIYRTRKSTWVRLWRNAFGVISNGYAVPQKRSLEFRQRSWKTGVDHRSRDTRRRDGRRKHQTISHSQSERNGSTYETESHGSCQSGDVPTDGKRRTTRTRKKSYKTHGTNANRHYH